MTIARRVIDIIGGPTKVSEIAGVAVSQVHRWTWPKSRGGTGGLIPAAHQQVLLNYAREHGLQLHPEHFFDAADIAAEDAKRCEPAQRVSVAAKPAKALRA
ncbi:MAG: hypothetical protein JO256_09160 [Alphaproteobacteria bacterium]|nr:hypothetical protein [Alphaproteobacteria bacterium]